MITINQNSENRIILNVSTSVSNPYFLIRFTNCTINISTIALFKTQSDFGFYIINIIEVGQNGIEDKVNGKLKLGPTGNWQSEVWAQASSTNLNPNMADEYLGDMETVVIGTSCGYNSDNDSCPTILEINGGDSGGDSQFIEINGLLDGCNS
jgi:hypothetical protein